MQTTIQRRSSTFTPPLKSFAGDLFSDSRFHGYQGPSRNVRLPRAVACGGGTVAKSEDGARCVVAGRESLRVLRLLDPEDAAAASEPKSTVGPGGHRIELSKNLWDGSGLKIESTTTDVAWCTGSYSNKVLTSARNGDLIMWDLDKAGSTKYERKTKNHIRSIHKLSCSPVVSYYCITGSADGDMRIWDLRDMTRSVMKIHHPTSVRSLVFSPSLSQPLQAVVGLDNGSIYRWDLHMGQRGQLDRLPVAHTGPILALDWCTTSSANRGVDTSPTQVERTWIVSGGLDHTVKVWDLLGSNTSSHIANKPMYVLHPSYPVRRVLWRPEYPCELAVVSNAEFSGGSGAELLASPRLQNATPSFLSVAAPVSEQRDAVSKSCLAGETVEIWDVCRGWIAKWSVDTTISDGGVTDAVFRDSHALWVQHAAGTFAQVDLRYSHRPIDAVPRVALTWNAVDGSDGALAFVTDKRSKWEVPYDDTHPDKRNLIAGRKKALGDKSRVPGQQNMGMYVHSSSENRGPGVFARLAKGYVVPEAPSRKREACILNAEIAAAAGDIHAAQAWILLGSLLTDIVPESMNTSLSTSARMDHPYPPIHSDAPPSNEAHNMAPVSIPASYCAVSTDVQPAASPVHSPSQSRVGYHRNSTQTPRSASNEERKNVRHHPETQPPPPTKPPPNSRNLTPVSSASSSPRHVPISLPLTPALPPTTTMTPTTVAQRRPSILVSTASLTHSHARRPSVYSRVTSTHSESPSAASTSDKSSLRHVGEGALDDSDSSEGAVSESLKDGGELERHVDAAFIGAPPPKPKPKSRMSKGRSMSAGRAGPAHPSPLSRLAGQQQWAEDEEDKEEPLLMGPGTCQSHPGGGADDEDASPSPLSTDTDGELSEDSDGIIRSRGVANARSQSQSMARSRSRKGSSVMRRWKSRSRSSTVASMAAPLVSPARSSPSVPLTGSPQHGISIYEGRGSQGSIETVVAASSREHESEVVPVDAGIVMDEEPPIWAEMDYQQKVAVVAMERELREAGWRALREALEEYANEGDVQMCAMLALVAPKELELGLGRTIQFVEAYINMLMRHRLHTCAAYLRKYCKVEEMQKSTRLETVIYTACQKCRKPVVAVRSRSSYVKATYAICATCREALVKCSICHLPVHTLLFQCSVCSHGGHQECYRRYYMERPMVELSVPSGMRGRQLQREQVEHEEARGMRERRKERGMAGHLCAAGCGHFCWVAVRQKDGDQNV